jgi:predicted histidine transporter YuiF (NhaC family)
MLENASEGVNMANIIAIIALIVSLLSAIFTYRQAKAACIQAQAAERSLRQAQRLKLFGSFDEASKSTIANPEFLYNG